MKCELLIGCGSNLNKRMTCDGTNEWSNLMTLDNNPAHKPNIVHDLTVMPLPFFDNMFDEIHAYEVLEHTGAQGDYKFFFAQFSEFWRVLKPGGHFLATCPSRHSPWALGDPSHTRVMQKEQLVFLRQSSYDAVGSTPMSDFRNIYRANFDIVAVTENEEHLHFVLKALKEESNG